MKTDIKTNTNVLRGKKTFGQKMADLFAKVIGSWTFIIVQSVFIFFWILLNIYAFINHWDPYPFVFLNLALSLQAAYAAPIILMSQNRETERDRARAMNDLATDRKAEKEIEEIQETLQRIERKLFLSDDKG